MAIQYFIVAAIVVIVIIYQIKAYRENEKRIDSIRDLFPDTDSSVEDDGENGKYIRNDSASGKFTETLADINAYLKENKNKTFDYHIIKEIVDRNSSSLEDEVDTMLAVPLYWGLMATIFGIAFGIVFFAWNDLANLLSGTNMSPEGIKILLTDIGIAMIASLAGVFFTKTSTVHFNSARTEMARNKNSLLTVVHTGLMSKYTDDITGALTKMTQDLNTFNGTFATNTRELKKTLSTVKDNYDNQVKLLEAIDKLKVNKIAKANIEVYDKLQGCTEEIEKLLRVFADSEDYVAQVVALNDKMGSVEERTRLFEELGNYFRDEMEFVRDRQGMMRQQMSSIDSVLQEALSNLGISMSKSIADLTSTFQSQNQRIQLLIDEQQKSIAQSLMQQQQVINEKIGQIDNPFSGLRETFEMGIAGIRASFELQNDAIAQVLSEQKASLETALEEQKKAIIKKLQETPGQLQAISELSKVLDKLEKTLAGQQIAGTSGGQSTPVANEDGSVAKLKAYFMPVCAGGSFVTLLILLILKLLGI